MQRGCDLYGRGEIQLGMKRFAKECVNPMGTGGEGGLGWMMQATMEEGKETRPRRIRQKVPACGAGNSRKHKVQTPLKHATNATERLKVFVEPPERATSSLLSNVVRPVHDAASCQLRQHTAAIGNQRQVNGLV